MDLSSAIDWAPPAQWQRVTVIDSHTGGEPFRLVVDGLPEIPGDTVLAKRRYAEVNLDGLRRALMWEPRGHADMYGGWIGDPVESDSDLSVLFVHNEGFSTMCGHGIIALCKVALDTGIVPQSGVETTLRIDTPAGQVTAVATHTKGTVTTVRFLNVPSFVVELDAKVDVDGLGSVEYDLSFGGGFYAYVDAPSINLDLTEMTGVVSAGRAIKRAIVESRDMDHPGDADLGFLYGVIFTGPAEKAGNHSRHVCVFADGEVDRSPTGTGVSGRLAILRLRDSLAIGEPVTIESITGSEFEGRIAATVLIGENDGIVPEVGGSAHILGRSEFWFDPEDDLGRGFFLR
ncbi:MAG: proline racemase family protein [Acidimicrobiia bacterium]